MITNQPITELLDSLSHPDILSSSEYRAIYELLEKCDDLSEAISVCEEFRYIAKQIIVKINLLKK